MQPLGKSNYDVVIFTDASLSGWGAACEGEERLGFWNQEEAKLHINHLELIAISHALKSFLRHRSGVRVLLRVDNMTAIAYINRMGGTQFPNLNRIARSIWQWCENRDIWLFASYIKSSDNLVADRLSRVKNVDTEWSLADFAFDSIVKNFFFPDIDLFASRINKKCEKYCSRISDPDCFEVDAMTIDWSDLNFYAFPPFALVLRVLKKVVQDKASGILVVPNWPSQPWFPLFMRLTVGRQLFFKPSADLLLSPCRSLVHPLAAHLTLIAANISDNHIGQKVWTQQQSR